MVRVNESEYLEATESYTGWCPLCKEFTTGSVEPDAQNYKCEMCGENSVMGAEEALMAGEIEFTEE